MTIYYGILSGQNALNEYAAMIFYKIYEIQQ